jgi:hypothetical protein
MVTVTTSWGEAEPAESSLLRAEVAAALRSEAQVESVVIDHPNGFVAVKVRLPEGLTQAERVSRRASVRGKLDVVIAAAFAGEGLVLAPVLIT